MPPFQRRRPQKAVEAAAEGEGAAAGSAAGDVAVLVVSVEGGDCSPCRSVRLAAADRRQFIWMQTNVATLVEQDERVRDAIWFENDACADAQEERLEAIAARFGCGDPKCGYPSTDGRTTD